MNRQSTSLRCFLNQSSPFCLPYQPVMVCVWQLDTYNLLNLVHCHMRRQQVKGDEGRGLWQWLAGEQTIYMAQVSSVLLTALKSDRRSDGWTSPSVLPPCLSACLTFRRWTSWEFRFDIRNLFENYIAFHAPTIVFVYKQRDLPPAACAFQAAARQVSNVSDQAASRRGTFLLYFVVSFHFFGIFN